MQLHLDSSKRSACNLSYELGTTVFSRFETFFPTVMRAISHNVMYVNEADWTTSHGVF